MGFIEWVGGVWSIDLENVEKERFYGFGDDKSFWCFLLFNSLKNSMEKFCDHLYTGCCRNSATTHSLGVAEIMQHSFTGYRRNSASTHTLNITEIL